MGSKECHREGQGMGQSECEGEKRWGRGMGGVGWESGKVIV